MTRKNPFNDKSKTLRFRLVQQSVRECGEEKDASDRIFEPVNKEAAHLAAVLNDGLIRKHQPPQPTIVLNTDKGLECPVEESALNVSGEAAKYGVYFDDRSYDYTKHLKPIGDTPGAVFIPAVNQPVREDECYDESIHDKGELAFNRALHANLREGSLDPTIREVLDALDDEAYVDEDLEDDFIVKLNRDEMAVLCPIPDYEPLYRKQKSNRLSTNLRDTNDTDDDATGDDEDDDLSISSEASSYCGTSYAASLAITSIDNKFDNILKIYDEDNDELDDVEIEDYDNNDERARAIDENLQEALDEFLQQQRNYIRPPGSERKKSAIELLDEIRNEMGTISGHLLDREISDTDVDADFGYSTSSSDGETFDCQSIITTFNNTENLPTIIREARKKMTTTPEIIRLSRKTGLPILSNGGGPPVKPTKDSDEEEQLENKGQARMKNETAEEKRARKAAIKSERREKRSHKKELRVRFKLAEIVETTRSKA